MACVVCGVIHTLSQWLGGIPVRGRRRFGGETLPEAAEKCHSPP